MYEELKAALLACESIPMAEYEWSTRPSGAYGVFQLDFEASDDNGDDLHQDRAWEGSVDLYTPGNAPEVWAEIEGILDEFCDGCWYVNTKAVENSTRMLHREYVFQLEAM